MDSNTVCLLIYSGVAIVVAIISATIMRVQQENWVRFDMGDMFPCMIFGVLWPLTIVSWVVYLASGFLCRKIIAKKGN